MFPSRRSGSGIAPSEIGERQSNREAGKARGEKGGWREEKERAENEGGKEGGERKRAMTHCVYPSVLVFTDDAGTTAILGDDSGTTGGVAADPCSRGGVNSRTRGDSP